jgi:hypothetical protein
VLTVWPRHVLRSTTGTCSTELSTRVLGYVYEYEYSYLYIVSRSSACRFYHCSFYPFYLNTTQYNQTRCSIALYRYSTGSPFDPENHYFFHCVFALVVSGVFHDTRIARQRLNRKTHLLSNKKQTKTNQYGFITIVPTGTAASNGCQGCLHSPIIDGR